MGRDRASVFRLREELLADVTGAPGRNYVTGALGINVTASNRVYWRSKPFTGNVPVTGSVNLPVILQCSEASEVARDRGLEDAEDAGDYFCVLAGGGS